MAKRKQTSKFQKSTDILSLDIGGSHVKGAVLDIDGKLKIEFQKVPTPKPATPAKVVAAIKTLIAKFPPFSKVSVGFPGYVKNGVVMTAPNLGTDFWKNVNLSKILEKELGQPSIVHNDADVQGIGVVDGKGLELVITLGTGFGTALLLDGKLMPHLEFAHQQVGKCKSYDEYVGEAAFEKLGIKKWNKRIKKVLVILQTVFNYDKLYIGGGNSKKLNFKLDKNIRIVNNEEGIKGGARLWK